MTIEIEGKDAGLVIRTPYSREFVSELKRLVPASERIYDGTTRTWVVDPRHGTTIQKLILTVFKTAVGLPAVKPGGSKVDRLEIRLEYLGQCKARADGSVSAYGHDGTGWNLVLPESVLRRFFGQDVEIEVEGLEGSSRPRPATLYAALVIGQQASFDEIRSAYRRMARLTHPDVNHEPDAARQFRDVQGAYAVLSDLVKRRRYDAGLALEASLKAPARKHRVIENDYFRSPLRCGLLVVDGERRLGRLVVSCIHSWSDITNDQGQVMVSSWNSNRETYEVNWA